MYEKDLTWRYLEPTLAKIPTRRTCQVTEAMIPIVATSSIEPAITKLQAKGMSKSSTLKSEEA